MSHAGPFDEELGSAAGLPDIGGTSQHSSGLMPNLLTFDAFGSHTRPKVQTCFNVLRTAWDSSKQFCSFHSLHIFLGNYLA